MTREEIDAIVHGYHGDPFRVLGPHRVEVDNCWVVRAYLPQAREVSLIMAGKKLPMDRLHDQGFYAVTLNVAPGRYKLRLNLWQGGTEEIEDPYRFPLLITDHDLERHANGVHYSAYDFLGAHFRDIGGVEGVQFAVWAPGAHAVSITGDFNEWDARRHPMRLRHGGVWEIFVPGVQEGSTYKYFIRSKYAGVHQMKADPYATAAEPPPRSASVVRRLNYRWNDHAWMEQRARTDWLKAPMSIYEVHLESWLKGPGGESLTYRQHAEKLVEYVKRARFTHIEFLPLMEHPYSGSWGYQVTGFFAPSARFGTPEDFMYLIDRCHHENIGVIMDWVPAHFPKDAHGLAYFDGTALYEHADPRMGEHRDWGTLIFNYGRNEVRAFLISSALCWLKRYHIDGLRVDAVASMLYLDYSREHGEWVPNKYGGRENLDAIDFLKIFNQEAHLVPGAVTIAEESTSFQGVSRPVYLNGLGFTMKWNMGWMHDMLRYFSMDPIFRKFNHNEITFSMLYAFSENFLLPISHDEVVHGKASLIAKMPGDEWRRFANVRAFLSYMYAHPGKKLLFMGSELGQHEEWSWQGSLRWELLQYEIHRKLQVFVSALNRLYCSEPALYEVDFDWHGFEWIDFHDVEKSVICFLRRAKDPDDFLVVVCNFTPEPRFGYRVGVPELCLYREILNSDGESFGGSNLGNGGSAGAEQVQQHGRPYSVNLTLPPLGVLVLKPVRHGRRIDLEQAPE
jgi:1,4-alpha-glucan branching enzyme